MGYPLAIHFFFLSNKAGIRCRHIRHIRSAY